MSNQFNDPMGDCELGQGCGALNLVINPKDKDLGGFSVRRLLPTQQRKTVGPWIFFDHMGPADFAAGDGVNVRPHPHIGLATVTYLFDGELLHRDSLGTEMAIQPGAINLMVAGRGIVHSERERPAVNSVPHKLHGLQLWLALPTEFETIEPAFFHYPAHQLPSLSVNGVTVRLLIGTAYGQTSPVKQYARTLYAEAHLQPGQQLLLPDAEERAVYVVSGSLTAADTHIPAQTMAIFDATAGVVIEAQTEARIAIIGGENIGHRYIDWNFVSSSKASIDQAKQDWREGKFPKVPGDETEFIPLPG